MCQFGEVVEVEETFARARVSVAVSKIPTSMSRGVLLWYPPHYGLRVVALRLVFACFYGKTEDSQDLRRVGYTDRQMQ